MQALCKIHKFQYEHLAKVHYEIHLDEVVKKS